MSIHTDTPTLADYHDLARAGLKLYRINNDPLTAHAAEILLQTTSVPLTRPQQNAALVLKNQVEAYRALFPLPAD